MPKEDKIEFEAEVIEVLPNALFKVKLESGNTMLTTLSGRMRTNNINVLLHDRVIVETSVYDFSKGRIIFRKK